MPILNELTSHTAQLAEFILTMGQALRSVTSLQLNVDFTQQIIEQTDTDRNSSGRSSIHSEVIGPTVPRDLSAEAGTQLASLLVAACPHVTSLGVGGGFGVEVMRVFGTHWPDLTSMAVLGTDLSIDRFVSLRHTQTLQRVTHLSIPQTAYDVQTAQLVWRLFFAVCPSLTHMDLGAGCLNLDRDVLNLPQQMEGLRCGNLTYSSGSNFPNWMQHVQLRELTLTYRQEPLISVIFLGSLLKAAPLLELLSVSQGNGCIVMLSDCTSTKMADVAYLHLRMVAGLSLRGVDYIPASFKINSNILPVQHLIGLVPHIAEVRSCEVSCVQPLSQVTLVLTELRSMSLRGPWSEFDFLDMDATVAFKHLRSLYVQMADLTPFTLLQLVACMPRLIYFRHSSQMVVRLNNDFRTRLRAGQVSVGGERNAVTQHLGDWSLQKDCLCKMIWTREVLAASMAPSDQLGLSISAEHSSYSFEHDYIF